MLVYDDKLEIAEKMLSRLYAMVTNEKNLHSKANIYSKGTTTKKRLNCLKACDIYRK
jgi:hypothetical protein